MKCRPSPSYSSDAASRSSSRGSQSPHHDPDIASLSEKGTTVEPLCARSSPARRCRLFMACPHVADLFMHLKAFFGQASPSQRYHTWRLIQWSFMKFLFLTFAPPGGFPAASGDTAKPNRIQPRIYLGKLGKARMFLSQSGMAFRH
jgi:hypothetical protein